MPRLARRIASRMARSSAPETDAEGSRAASMFPIDGIRMLMNEKSPQADTRGAHAAHRPDASDSRDHPSPIQTVTVGSGIAPDLLWAHRPRLAGFHRRWGLSPRPEGCLQLRKDRRTKRRLAQEDELLGLDLSVRFQTVEVGPARERAPAIVRTVPGELVLAGGHGAVGQAPNARARDVE